MRFSHLWCCYMKSMACLLSAPFLSINFSLCVDPLKNCQGTQKKPSDRDFVCDFCTTWLRFLLISTCFSQGSHRGLSHACIHVKCSEMSVSHLLFRCGEGNVIWLNPLHSFNILMESWLMFSYFHSQTGLGLTVMNNAEKFLIFMLTRGFKLGEVR